MSPRPHLMGGLKDFNPRSPRGGATGKCWCIAVIMVFQSTLPTRGSDALIGSIVDVCAQFQSTLPTRGSDCLMHMLKIKVI